MRCPGISTIKLPALLTLILTNPLPATSHPLSTTNISIALFASLEELSRIVDISYCVGTSGISHPFSCASRCDEFPSFELVDTFNTGPLLSDSCGYIALDHGERAKRLIVAFRGTYSIANTIVDLSTVPQEYVPYPGDPVGNGSGTATPAPILPASGRKPLFWKWMPRFRRTGQKERGGGGGRTAESSGGDHDGEEKITCGNCTVHSGFWTSWQNTRPFVLPYIKEMRAKYPDYKLHLVGHSLGGAVAALAGIEFNALGWEPTVTTFGEPKIGNAGLRAFVDRSFGLPHGNGSREPDADGGRYRRVTHVDDPVPLLPLREWGYEPHAGEVYIAKSALQPAVSDVRLCRGDADVDCIAAAEASESWFNSLVADMLSPSSTTAAQEEDVLFELGDEDEEVRGFRKRWGLPIPSRYKMWQLFFAHRDYFWRLGLCVAGGDPADWGRDKYKFPGQERGEL